MTQGLDWHPERPIFRAYRDPSCSSSGGGRGHRIHHTNMRPHRADNIAKLTWHGVAQVVHDRCQRQPSSLQHSLVVPPDDVLYGERVFEAGGGRGGSGSCGRGRAQPVGWKLRQTPHAAHRRGRGRCRCSRHGRRLLHLAGMGRLRRLGLRRWLLRGLRREVWRLRSRSWLLVEIGHHVRRRRRRLGRVVMVVMMCRVVVVVVVVMRVVGMVGVQMTSGPRTGRALAASCVQVSMVCAQYLEALAAPQEAPILEHVTAVRV